MQYVKLDAGAEEAIKNGSNAGGNSKGDAPVTTYTNVSVVGKIQSGKEATMYAAALEKAGTEILTVPSSTIPSGIRLPLAATPAGSRAIPSICPPSPARLRSIA